MNDSLAFDADDRQQGGIQVIARMSRIMRTLSSHGQASGLSLAAIAAEVDLPRSTVQRIINALVAENIVEPAGPTGFRIGPALGQMLYKTHSDVVPILRPHVEQLSLKLQETVCLARLQMHKLHVVDAIVGEQTLRVVPQLGIVPPPHITAAGKALLARMDDASLHAWMDEATPAHEQAALLQHIATVRTQGFATDQDQIVLGIAALAVAINTYRGAYAIMLLAPTARMQAHQTQFKQELFALRDSMEKLLGTQALPDFN